MPQSVESITPVGRAVPANGIAKFFKPRERRAQHALQRRELYDRYPRSKLFHLHAPSGNAENKNEKTMSNTLKDYRTWCLLVGPYSHAGTVHAPQ